MILKKLAKKKCQSEIKNLFEIEQNMVGENLIVKLN